MSCLRRVVLGAGFLALVSTNPVAAQGMLRFPAADTVDGLEYRAGIEPTHEGMNIRGVLATQGGYRVFLVAKNVSSEPIERVLHGGCMLEPKVYLVAPKRQRRTRRARKGESSINLCEFDAVRLRLNPGEEDKVDRWAKATYPRFVLGDSLPSGEYVVTARIRPNEWREPPLEIYAGRVRLNLSAFPQTPKP